MKQRVLYLLKLYLYFFVFFVFAKLVFLAFYQKLTLEAGLINSFKTFWYGLRLDLSAAAYFMIFPIIILLFSALFHKDLFKAVIPKYVLTLSILLVFLLVVDLELYHFWGFRLDITPLLYIKTPKEALASISVWEILRQLLITGVIIFGLVWFMKKLLRIIQGENYHWKEIPIYLFLLALLIIPIRGGFGIAPLNVGSAYFSQNNYLNHAAINVYWNIGNSLANQSKKTNKYNYFNEERSEELVKPYLNTNDTTGVKFISTNKPNIVLIMMESFTANVIEPLGGLSGITPSFNSLAKEGILFTSLYSTGDRSDKGLLGILSGYPAQATFSVIMDAAKTQSLPKLPLDLKNSGYNTSFYYGGDLNFANMRSYLISAGFSKLISKDDFSKDSWNSKWGAHDEFVFNKLLVDLNDSKYPFFKMIFTLSSHEPFEVPVEHVKGDDEASKFLNSVYYTDSCLGDFIRKAKQQKWWKNTWIIIVADHGIRLPGNLKVHVPEKFHIPMLWLGGAVTKTAKIEKTASQIDIPVTILNQLGIKSGNYLFSRNLFGKKQKTDAFYIFNNGVGMVNDSMKLVFDCTKNGLLIKKGAVSDSMVNTSKAYIQTIYSDLNKRK